MIENLHGRLGPGNMTESDLWISDVDGVVGDARGARFDPWARRWSAEQPVPVDARPAGAAEAVAWLFARPDCRRVPVGVIGPREPTEVQAETAETLGRRLGALNLTVLTGGRGGVMAAASRGVRSAGGLTIALLPGDEWETANDAVALPLATGIGSARNALIARSSLALIAVGGSYGTMTEIAYGLHFGRPVFTLCDAPSVPGARACPDIEAVLGGLLPVLLARDTATATGDM